MEASEEFEFEIVQEESDQEQQEMQVEISEENHYKALLQENPKESEELISLQLTLKSENLLLEYEEKRKNQRVKEIEYTFVNAYNNYLYFKQKNEKDLKENVIIANQKDLSNIDENLCDQLKIIEKKVMNLQTMEAIIRNFKDSSILTLGFLNDFMNFFPNWHQHISTIISIQVQNAQSIQNVFETEYTSSYKFIASISLKNSIQCFAETIFSQLLTELHQTKEELLIDFVQIYEKWTEDIFERNHLKNLREFLENKLFDQIDSIPNQYLNENKSMELKIDLQYIYGNIKNNEELRLLLEEMIHFSKKSQAISFLMGQIGSEELHLQSLNLRLAWIIWKKVLKNRKKIQIIATMFVECILNNYQIYPEEIKYIINEYHHQMKSKFGKEGNMLENLKNFFNKLIFSQYFFTSFINLYERQCKISEKNNYNLTMIALISQKIMFSQQFYQKYKYGYFNQLINHFNPKVNHFIKKFISISKVKQVQTNQQTIQSSLLSLQTVSFLYLQLRIANGIKRLNVFQEKIQNKDSHTIGYVKFPIKNIFIIFSRKTAFQINYLDFLKPSEKNKKILIQFLLLIDKIPEKFILQTLLQQYRCNDDDVTSSYLSSSNSFKNKPSIKLYSNYLLYEIINKKVSLIDLINSIKQDIKDYKAKVESIKISLEKQYNFCVNLEKKFMKDLENKKKKNNQKNVQEIIFSLFQSPLGFDYEITEGKIYQKNEESDKTIGKCLTDISSFFLKRYQGTDGLFHMLIQKVADQIEKKGVTNEFVINSAKNIIGQRLYTTVKLDSQMSSKDEILYEKIKKHKFVTFGVHELQFLEDDEQLIYELCLESLEKLSQPSAADTLLSVFNETIQIFQNIFVINNKSSDITADLQISVMLCIIIRSQIKNLYSILDFIEMFCYGDINSNIFGQTLTLVKSVIFLIEEMDAKRLKLTQEEYQKLVQKSDFISEA